jgi:hypothetical protein
MNRTLIGTFVFITAAAGRAGFSAEPDIDIQFVADASPKLRAVAAHWAEREKSAVAAYYGEFPVERLRIKITPRAGGRARGGTAYGWSGPLITISLGRDATDADLADDWLLTHEMLHLGFPSLPERHHWLEEGIATYVEPIARARAGQLSPERAWLDLVSGLPQGQPEVGDRGLDATHTWGRTYWGGALFCLRADVEIRKRTENRKGLEHALRAIRAAGGTIEVEWPIDKAIAIGDRSTGVPVLREIYDEMKGTPVTVPLDTLWQQLGIVRRDHAISFDNTAPLAEIRRAITRR